MSHQQPVNGQQPENKIASFASWISDVRTILGVVVALAVGIFTAGRLYQQTLSEIEQYKNRLAAVEQSVGALKNDVSRLNGLIDGLSRWPNATPSPAGRSGVAGGDQNPDSVCGPGEYVVGVKSNAASTVKTLFSVTVLCQRLNTR